METASTSWRMCFTYQFRLWTVDVLLRLVGNGSGIVRSVGKWIRAVVRLWGMTGLRRCMARLGPHWPLLVVLLAGAGLRLITMLAYAPGLWFSGDSGIYVRSAYSLAPDPARPLGYSIFLRPLLPFHSVRLIVAVQHLIGLAVAVALYVFMWRRGVRRWVATAVVAVFVLDARTAALEHFLLAETVYTAFLVAGLLTLCWRERPGPLACGAAGLLFAAASGHPHRGIASDRPRRALPAGPAGKLVVGRYIRGGDRRPTRRLRRSQPPSQRRFLAESVQRAVSLGTGVHLCGV